MTVRGRVLVAAAAVMAVGLSGCSLLAGQDDAGTPRTPSTAARMPPPGAEALARYYSQTLAWKTCGRAECAGLSVPLDYSQPDGETITVQVLRVKATRQSQRLGSLVVNPGGPGASGIDYARSADFIVGRAVRQRFDVVGFDPRGVQRSAPVDCLADEQLDQHLSQDPSPDTPAEEQALLGSMKSLGEACQARTGARLGHISTEEAARDMDVLRAALGESQLDYLGKSYGTQLGAVYAGLFPKQVGRFVLDGVLAPDLTWQEIALGQAEGFERAARAWAQACVEEGCPLGGSVDEVLAAVSELLTRLDSEPVPMRDGRQSQLTEGWAILGVVQAMYDQGAWDTLTKALTRTLRNNDGTMLMQIADEYARRTTSGLYTSNLLEAFWAITCLDAPSSPNAQDYARLAAEAARKAPVFGKFLAWGSAVCGQWPVKAGPGPRRVTAEGSGPIVVIGTSRDPATPYEWSVRLRDQLANARLISLDGDGHTAYMRANDRCVDRAVDDYYVKGTVPDDGLRCG